MPWVPADTGPRTIGRLPELAPAVDTPDLAAPGILDTIGAAWRTQNIIGSSLSNDMLGADLDTVEQDFNPFEAARGTKYEAYPERLAQLYNRKAFETFRAQVDREEEDRRTLDAAGALGVIAQIGAGVVDPTILVPGGALVRGGKIGYSVGRSALAVGAGSAAGVAVQESILQGTQETRTAEETGLAIGGGAILGALVGAAGAKILDNLAWNNLASRLEADLASKEPLPIDVNDAEMRALYEANVPTDAASAGAAAPMRESLEGLSIAGRAANIAANPVARLNPILRALTSPSAEYRRIATSLMENPIYLKANMEGRASEVAVESLVKEAMGSYTVAVERNNEIFSEMRKAGIAMKRDEFKERIGRALRNNDVDPGGNEYVTKAAREWREKVFEPGRVRAVEAGILAADAKVTTAPSYYHRMYNVPMIEANEGEFKAIVREWAREAIARQNKAEAARKRKRATNLRSEADEIEMRILRQQSEMAARDAGEEIPIDSATEASVLRAIRSIQAGTKKKAPETLTQFLARKGGLHDFNGELEAIGISNKTRPGFVRKDRRKFGSKDGGGLDFDDAALMAWEGGFLPGTERPTVNEFLDALADDFNGRRRFVRQADMEAAAELDLYDRIIADLERMGVDTGARKQFFSTSEDLKGFVSRVAKALELSDRARADELRRIVSDLERELDEMVSVLTDDPTLKMEADAYIEEVVNSIYSKITGRGDPDMGENPFRIVANKRGPLKERTFNIEDAKIEKFLESDVEMVGRRYSRVMSADAEIARKFGRADLNEQIEAVRADYAKIRSGVTDERELRKLNAAEKSDVADLKAIRDMLRGQYLPEQNGSNYARIVNAAMTFNYIRAMGGVVAASLADVARPIMVHGLSRFMGDGVAPLVKNLKAFKLSAQEAKLAGTVGERIRDGALSTLAELTDPYARSSPFERWLENGAKAFGKATGMPYWNDFMKSFSSVMTQNRIIGNAVDFGKINHRERAYLAYLGIDQSMAERIAKQFADHGQDIDGVKVASTEDWTDDVARRTYRAAVAKDVDSIIITKGIGDVPLFARTPTGRALLQFKGFALASHQRALIRGLQEDKLNTLSGLIAMSTIGMFIYWLKSVESNRLEDISDNPGRWIAEGLDRSGFLAIPFEINNTAEKFGVPGVYTGMQAMFPNATQKAPASRYAVRSVVDSLLGPSIGLAKDVADMIGASAQMDLKPADINTMRRLTPGASLPVIRSLVEYGVLPELKEAVQ